MCYDEMTKLSHAIKRGSPNVKEHAEVLKKTFIETGAPKEVNISTEERKALIAAIDALGNGPAEAREKAVSFGSPSSPASPSSLGTSPGKVLTQCSLQASTLETHKDFSLPTKCRHQFIERCSLI